MKKLHTLYIRDNPKGREELWAMVQEGWRHRAYIVRKMRNGFGALGRDNTAIHSIEVDVMVPKNKKGAR